MTQNIIDLHGKYANPRLYIETVDDVTIGQVLNMSNERAMEDTTIRIMPDAHYGKGSTIGTTIQYKNGIKRVVPDIVGVDIGCVDKDTEYLTDSGWVKISDYNGEKIAVYDKDNDNTSFEQPLAYIKQPNDEFYHLKTKYGIDQMLTGEHICLFEKGPHHRPNRREEKYTMQMSEVYDRHNTIKLGHRDSFIIDIPNLDLSSKKGVPLSDIELRLAIMIMADGTIRNHNTGYVAIGLRRERKIKRTEMLLLESKIKYTKKIVKVNDVDETTTFNFYHNWITKRMKSLWDANEHQLKIIADEVKHWDWAIDSHTYASTIESDVDFIQYVFATLGFRTSINKTYGKHYTTEYLYRVLVSQTSKPRAQLAGTPKTEINIVKSQDGFKYCFTTSTGFWIMRRNGNIVVTGNCSIRATKLKLTHLSQKDLEKLDQVIKEYVPAGFNVHSRPTNRINQAKIDTILKNITLDVVRTPNEYNRLKLSVGTLGGGNHYIAVEKFGEDYYLMTHTGSRRLGALVASTHQKIADKSFEKGDLAGFINDLKEQGRHKDIERLSAQFKQETRDNLPNLRYLEGYPMDNYLNDMHYTQEYAWLNHEAITNEILTRMNWEAADSIHSMHNYIDVDKHILRKGATDASLGTRLIVPLNMRDGSLIAVGKGNPDWNFSAPHGAGRVLSRGKAKDQLSFDDYKAKMTGIYTSSVVQSTLDEAPDAYKPAQEIIDNTGDTMNIIAHTKPVFNFKAH